MIGGTRGGFNRARIIRALSDSPQNAHQLSKQLDVDYSTIRHHVEVMEKNDLLTSIGDRYGKLYFLSDIMNENFDYFEEIWEKICKKKISSEEEKKTDESE
ncbi:MAG: winged helix-turn-helix domain-containing protein [Candidatus Bathyarchaeota archaeon]|nr:winged helix-turn-helix domain-containing protein [Candidatus Bathyarchaeota archaeon]